MEILLNREILEEVRITRTATLAFKTTLDLTKIVPITLLVEQAPKTRAGLLSCLTTAVGRAL